MAPNLLAGPLPLFFVQKPPFTIEVADYEPVPGETIPRRHPKARDGLRERPAPDVTTVFDLIRRTAEKYGNAQAIGSRKLIKTHKEITHVPKTVEGKVVQTEKEWTYFELSPYSFQTYREYFDLTLQLGAGLRKLGLNPGDKLHIFAATR